MNFSGIVEAYLDPLRACGSRRMLLRSFGMRKAERLDDLSSKTKVDLVVVVEVRKLFAPVEQRCSSRYL